VDEVVAENQRRLVDGEHEMDQVESVMVVEEAVEK
jgi:hypothetical protein